MLSRDLENMAEAVRGVRDLPQWALDMFEMTEVLLVSCAVEARALECRLLPSLASGTPEGCVDLRAERQKRRLRPSVGSAEVVA